MKYGKYWFHLQFFFIVNFQVLGLLKAKKNLSVTRCCRSGVRQKFYRRYLSRLKGYRFETSATLRQNFEILKSQESKKFKSVSSFL
jgi:hypothetical protein